MEQRKNCEVSLLLTDDDEIQRLNRIYRNIDTPTDVLAFSLIEGSEDSYLPEEIDTYLLGDIIISTETAERQAKHLEHSFQYELSVLIIHGFLHLLGFDHVSKEDAEKMQFLENKILHHLMRVVE